MKKEENPSKGRGNPDGSQSGGTARKETTEELKEQSKKDKEKRKNSEGKYKTKDDNKSRE